MTALRGDIRLAKLNPVRGSEQAGTHPVLVMQTNAINRFTTTTPAIPFTTNLRRASLPSCVQLAAVEAGLKIRSQPDVIVRSKHANNAGKLAAWDSASRIEHKKKKEPSVPQVQGRLNDKQRKGHLRDVMTMMSYSNYLE